VVELPREFGESPLTMAARAIVLGISVVFGLSTACATQTTLDRDDDLSSAGGPNVNAGTGGVQDSGGSANAGTPGAGGAGSTGAGSDGNAAATGGTGTAGTGTGGSGTAATGGTASTCDVMNDAQMGLPSCDACLGELCCDQYKACDTGTECGNLQNCANSLCLSATAEEYQACLETNCGALLTSIAVAGWNARTDCMRGVCLSSCQ
jgi:hypothetical protein